MAEIGIKYNSWSPQKVNRHVAIITTISKIGLLRIKPNNLQGQMHNRFAKNNRISYNYLIKILSKSWRERLIPKQESSITAKLK